jgi:hypothetical protein
MERCHRLAALKRNEWILFNNDYFVAFCQVLCIAIKPNLASFSVWSKSRLQISDDYVILPLFNLAFLLLQGYYKDTVEFYFDSRNECKNFWKKCIEHHAFFRCQSVKKLPRNKTRVVSKGSSFRLVLIYLVRLRALSYNCSFFFNSYHWMSMLSIFFSLLWISIEFQVQWTHAETISWIC